MEEEIILIVKPNDSTTVPALNVEIVAIVHRLGYGKASVIKAHLLHGIISIHTTEEKMETQLRDLGYLVERL